MINNNLVNPLFLRNSLHQILNFNKVDFEELIENLKN